MHNVGNIQRALVDDGYGTNGLVRAGLDRERGSVLSGVRGGAAPLPGVSGRGLYRELPFGDVRDTDCKK